jgi:mutator family transposase
LGSGFSAARAPSFWLQVLTDLKQRGVADVLVACVDGLTGFPEAIEAVFPQTWVQTCLVHLVRASLRFVPYRDKRAVAADLKKIYTAVDQDVAADELQRFAEKWDQRYPTISRSWLEHWERIIPFLAFPPDVRRAVYTTNTMEALNRQIRKIIKTRGQFPTEDAARKLIYLAITRAQTKWRRASQLEHRAGRVQDSLRRSHPRQRNLTFTPSHHRSNCYSDTLKTDVYLLAPDKRLSTKTATPLKSVRPFGAIWVVPWSSGWMLSGAADGERVEVVGQDRPAGPGHRSVMAFGAGAPQALAALEVADAPLDPGAVAGSAFAGAS